MPDFIWQPGARNGAGAYQDTTTGRFLSNAAVRDSLDTYIDNAQDPMESLYSLLRSNQISVADWQLQMRDQIKSTHVNAAASAMGGRDQMTQSDWGRTGQLIRGQYEYLDNFAQQIADGLPIDGRVQERMKMYTEAARGTHEKFTQIRMGNAGYDMESSRLDPQAKHCEGEGSCIEQAGRGFVPLGELIPIGQRICKSRDRCTMEYMNSLTGEIVT